MFITLDDYYTIAEYNEALQALDNNGFKYKEYINTKPPYQWFIEVPQRPMMVNYDELPKAELRFIVNKVEPARANEEYLLQRRVSDDGKKALKKYVFNKPLLEAQSSDYACFFQVRNKEQMLELSQKLGKLYYFGRYYTKFRIGLCTNKMIRNFIDPEDILVQKEKSILQMEQDLNFKIFKLNDRLRKFTETPYFLDGQFHQVKIKKFNTTL